MKTRLLIISGIIFAAILVTGLSQSFMFPGLTCPPGTFAKNNIECIANVELEQKYLDMTSSYMDEIIPTLDDFRNTLNESQDIETIFLKFGDPHADIGSGIHIYVYELNDLTQIWIGYANYIIYVQHVDSDGNILEQLFQLENGNFGS